MTKCVVRESDYQRLFRAQRTVTTGLRAIRNDNVIGAIGVSMEAAEYRPCQNCGSLTDSGVCSDSCASDLDFAKKQTARLAAGDIDEDGNELGDYCVWCGAWFLYELAGLNAIYCGDLCALQAEMD